MTQDLKILERTSDEIVLTNFDNGLISGQLRRLNTECLAHSNCILSWTLSDQEIGSEQPVKLFPLNKRFHSKRRNRNFSTGFYHCKGSCSVRDDQILNHVV